MITDTFGRAWRRGVVNVSIGCAGIPALVDLRGTADHHGRELEATVVALADEVAAASGLAMGKASRVQAALVRGVAFDAATREFVASQRYNADRPEARAALGSFHAARGAAQAAEAELGAALRMEPGFVPAYANLADLRRSQGRDTEAESILREGIARNPGASDKLFTPMILGLALIESLVIYSLVISFMILGKV